MHDKYVMYYALWGRPHMISDLWGGGDVSEDLISLIKNELYTMKKSDMGGWVGQKLAQKMVYHMWMAPNDILC